MSIRILSDSRYPAAEVFLQATRSLSDAAYSAALDRPQATRSIIAMIPSFFPKQDVRAELLLSVASYLSLSLCELALLSAVHHGEPRPRATGRAELASQRPSDHPSMFPGLPNQRAPDVPIRSALH